MKVSNKIQLLLKGGLSYNEQKFFDKLEMKNIWQNLASRTKVDIHIYYLTLKQHRQNNDFFIIVSLPNTRFHVNSNMW